MTELAANRETDARVAEAMGLTVVAMDWPCGREPECGCYEASNVLPAYGSWYTEKGPVVAAMEGGWPPYALEDEPGRTYASVEPVAFYAVDPALIPALMERIAELTDGAMVELRRYAARRWMAHVEHGQRIPEIAESPNLAICALLLRVAEVVQR